MSQILSKRRRPIFKADGKAARAELSNKLIDTLVKETQHQGNLFIIRHGFKFYGKTFKLAYFKPAHGLVPETLALFKENRLHVTRQVPCHPADGSTVDMRKLLNGILIQLKSKNFYRPDMEKCSLSIQNGLRSTGAAFLFKKGAVVHFAVDPDEVHMATPLNGGKTFFLILQSRQSSR